jgi:hypothetical protein
MKKEMLREKAKGNRNVRRKKKGFIEEFKKYPEFKIYFQRKKCLNDLIF